MNVNKKTACRCFACRLLGHRNLLQTDRDLEVSILKSVEEDGEPILCAVEDEAELEAVYNLIMDALYEEEEE